MKDDIFMAIKPVFRVKKIWGGLNATYICLIPKFHNPKYVKDFRPISCYNVLYQAITKIVAERLKIMIADLESANKTTFLLDRCIQGNLMVNRGYSHKHKKICFEGRHYRGI